VENGKWEMGGGGVWRDEVNKAESRVVLWLLFRSLSLLALLFTLVKTNLGKYEFLIQFYKSCMFWSLCLNFWRVETLLQHFCLISYAKSGRVQRPHTHNQPYTYAISLQSNQIIYIY